MKDMKVSRRFVLIVCLAILLIFSGAILGSLIPKVAIYAIVAAVSLGVIVIGLWFYSGRKEDENEDENNE